MHTFVEFQRHFLSVLFSVRERNPALLKRLLSINTLGGVVGGADHEALLGFNFSLPSGDDWGVEVYQKILRELVTIRGEEIVIDYQLGDPLPPQDTYGLDQLERMSGSGINMLRTKTCAQPAALKKGDILCTGEHVLSLPRGGYNGTVLVALGDEGTNTKHATWLELLPRIPIALRKAVNS